MNEEYDTISPNERVKLGKHFLRLIDEGNEDVDIVIDNMVDMTTGLNKRVLRNFLNDLAQLITEPN